MTPIELLCFHHAGGGSASFHPLRPALAALGAEAALTTLKLPGRESRGDEPRYVDADACVRALVEELDDLLSRPHVLLGHSMGALLAYSLAQQRISRGLCAPEAVIVAAYRAPHLRGPMHDLHLADDNELAAELARYGGLPAEILSRPEWLELLMPSSATICGSASPTGLRVSRRCRARCTSSAAATTRWRRRTRWPPGRVIRRSRNRSVSSLATTFCSVSRTRSW